MDKSQNYVNLHVSTYRTFLSFIGIVKMGSKEGAVTGKSDLKKKKLGLFHRRYCGFSLCINNATKCTHPFEN